MADSALAAVELSGSAAVQKDGLIGWVERRPHAAFGWFLALHFAVWTALPALLFANLPGDVIEGLIFGPEWVIGSYKLPPLPWWLLEITHRVFGADAAYYALSQAAVVVAFGFVFVTARSLVGATGALVAVLIVDGMRYFHYSAVIFNHNVLQLPFWALAGYAFYAALKRGRLGHWLLLGFALGGALWAKYFVIMLAIPYALFLLFDRQARRTLATPGPWLALAVAFIVAAPHLGWLFQNHFVPVQYVSSHSAPVRGWFDHIRHPGEFAKGQMLFLLPSLFIAAALIWPVSNSPLPAARQANPIDAFDRRMVALIAFGPALTMIAFTAASGRGTMPMWGSPLWLYVGLWIVMAFPGTLDAVRLRRVVGAWSAVFVLFALVFAADCSTRYFDRRFLPMFFPGSKFAAEMTQHFHAATGQPLSYVIGPTLLAGNLSYYSPDRPKVLIGGEPSWTPWIDLNDLRAKGAVVVWNGSDEEHLPATYAAIAGNAEVGAPVTLPRQRGHGAVQIGWAILKPQ